VTSNEWVTMRQFAAALADGAACQVKFNGSSKVRRGGFVWTPAHCCCCCCRRRILVLAVAL